MLVIPGYIEELLVQLEISGYECYLVGGCVRDMIMNRVPKDFDICTNALPDHVLQVFSHKKTLETGKKHGTITVIQEGHFVEITTFRHDGNYSDGRRPDSVTFKSSIEEDLSRRDFTINAIAYRNGFIDPFNGISDIKNKLVCCDGLGEQRFKEDSLRILRGIRFAATLKFEVEKNTKNQMIKNKFLLKNISSERKTQEILKILNEKDIFNILMEFKDVFQLILFDTHDICNWKQICYATSNCETDIVLRLAILFYAIKDIDYKHCLCVLKLDKRTICGVTSILDNIDIELSDNRIFLRKKLQLLMENDLINIITAKEVLYKANIISEQTDFTKVLNVVKDIINAGECYKLRDLAINGTDIINMGISSGEKVGETLSNCLNMVIEGKLYNNRYDLLNYVKDSK